MFTDSIVIIRVRGEAKTFTILDNGFTDDDSLPVVDGDSEKNFAGLSDVETQQVLAVVLAVVVAALAGCCFCRMCRSGRRRNAGFYSGVEAMDGDLELQPTYANIPIT